MGDPIKRLETELAELRAFAAEQSAKLAEQRELIAKLLKQIDVLSNGRRGPSSEKRHVDWREALAGITGLLPFPELEQIKQDLEKAKAAEEEERKRRKNKPGRGKKRGPRSDFPSTLPQLVEELPVPVEERYCCGHERRTIGFEQTKRLERISTSYVVITRREKLAPCGECREGSILTAPAPAPVIEGGLLGPSMLAWAISQHFGHHMPYFRLEQQLRGEGLGLSRSVLCSSAVRCGELLRPIARVVEQYVLSRDLVQVDDTGVTVRNGPNPGRASWHIWAYRALDGPVFYRVTESRCSGAVRDVLGGFEGRVQADACSVYDFLFQQGGVRTEVGCWSHMRRGFVKASEIEPDLTKEILDLIRAVYEIERLGKQQRLIGDELLALRQTRSQPLTNGVKAWLELTRPKVLPKGPMGKAIQYALNHWTALTVFLTDPKILEIDNNGCEYALRAVAVGRKNWLFFGDAQAGPSNVNLMTLVNTCKALDIDPERYLTDVLLRINDTPASQVERLAPLQWRDDPAAQARASDRRAGQMAALGKLIVPAIAQ